MQWPMPISSVVLSHFLPGNIQSILFKAHCTLIFISKAVYQVKCSLLKFTSTQNFRMLPYLEVGSLQR